MFGLDGKDGIFFLYTVFIELFILVFLGFIDMFWDLMIKLCNFKGIKGIRKEIVYQICGRILAFLELEVVNKNEVKLQLLD